MSKPRTISTMDEAIAELGGPRKIATYLGIDEGAVVNWRERKFPAWTYVAVSAAFEQENITIDPALCNQRWAAVPWQAVRNGQARYQSRRKKRGRHARR